ncbi:MAG: FkbM family methyltransferase, partial [Ignavibacteria bacterium]|nr:FkbM family methyltransferase [Ignavibacteria bacterium]
MNIFEKTKLIPDALRGQLFSDPEKNGEYKFLSQFLSEKKNLIIFDVGANVGDYSEKILSLNPNVLLYCFEPVQSTFNTLSQKLDHKSNIFTFNFAFGDRAAEENIFIYGDDAGSNSLYYNQRHALLSKDLHKEKIRIETLDNFVQENNIIRIDF